MGGYVGSRAVNLSTTAADVSGNATIGGNLTVSGTTVTIDSANAQTVDLGDNDKIRLGDGDDLQIYHDGSASYVSDTGTGGLKLMGSDFVALQSATGENYVVGGANDATTVYHNNVAKLATTSTGVDVTGKLGTSANNNAGAKANYIRITDTDTSATAANQQGGIEFYASDSSAGAGVTASMEVVYAGSGGGGEITFNTAANSGAGVSEAMRIDESGNVGIGTSSPAVPLHIDMGTDNNALYIQSSDQFANIGLIDGSGSGKIIMDGGELAFTTGGNATTSFTGSSERMRIDALGNVGIGVVPKTGGSTWQHIQFGGTGNIIGRISDSTVDAIFASNYYINSSGTDSYIATGDAARMFFNDDVISFSNAGSGSADAAISWNERMRIDSSGNLLVGTTSSTPHNLTSGGGFAVRGPLEALLSVARESNECAIFNRTNTDGDIALFRKNGSTVGSIGVVSGDVYIQGPTNHSGIQFNTNGILPLRNGAIIDNTLDLGGASYRWDDIYATNGTIQTSDQNEKQDIAELSDAEQRVAVAAKGLLRKFRWIDAVAEKGDDARIHFGIIAQDLQDAFTAEGLDAGRYAMFISTTWWETQTEVPAVEAVAEVLDEDGNVVTEAVEAKEAYTRTDTYETAEEAPEGATERTRLGVRYPELLAFIIGAM